MPNDTPPPHRRRLNSWKEVGAFFGKNESTVKRWEARRGLPIHRLPGDARSGIYAEVDELEAWLKGQGGAVDEVAPQDDARPPVIRPATARRSWPWLAAGVAAVVLAVAFVLLRPLIVPPPQVPQAARDLYAKGMRDWQARTPDSLNRAVVEFNQAIHLAPDYAEPYAGLALSYDLLREYTAMPSSEAFPLARANARRAIALDDRVASAHTALAFADFFGFWDYQGARREYERALVLDPSDANTEHWYATTLLSHRECAAASAHINRAFALDPQSVSIQADRGQILYACDKPADKAGDKAILTGLEAAYPDFPSPHVYLANIDYLAGDDAGFLREAGFLARRNDDAGEQAALAAAAAGLARGGHAGMLQALLRARLDQFRRGQTSAYNVAALMAQTGHGDDAVTYLRLAFDRRELQVIDTVADDRFAAIRHMPAYLDQVARLHP